MKRTLKNIFLWLLVAALGVVLYYGVLYPQKWQQIQDQISTSSGNVISELMQQRNELEQQKAELQKSMEELIKGPSSAFVLFLQMEETNLQEAAEVIDQYGYGALLGVTNDELMLWSHDGTPSYVSERLEKGWEICLVLEDTAASLMQEQLNALNLPPAKIAYQKGTALADSASGILIVMEHRVQSYEENEEIWHISAIGNMNRDALEVYSSKRGTADGVAFIVGGQDADQRYVQGNMMALLNLIQQDSQNQLMQCTSAEAAYLQHQEQQERIAPQKEQLDQTLELLNQQINEIMDQITSTPM